MAKQLFFLGEQVDPTFAVCGIIMARAHALSFNYHLFRRLNAILSLTCLLSLSIIFIGVLFQFVFKRFLANRIFISIQYTVRQTHNSLKFPFFLIAQRFKN